MAHVLNMGGRIDFESSAEVVHRVSASGAGHADCARRVGDFRAMLPLVRAGLQGYRHCSEASSYCVNASINWALVMLERPAISRRRASASKLSLVWVCNDAEASRGCA